jgi:hypothetical protein
MVQFIGKALTVLSFFFLLSSATLPALADEEAANRAYVTASKYGQFYAKSVPHESYGFKGVTRVYQVTGEEDRLIQRYDWYTPKLFVDGFGATIYVVQMGPWHRGHLASPDEHAIAFYKDDRLLKKYSTLDIAGAKDNVSSSVSHYTVFSGEPVFRRPFGNHLIFDIKTHTGETLSFDTETGLIISKEEEGIKKRLYEAVVKIARLKWRWYESNKEKISDIKGLLITRDVLMKFSPKEFPALPDGYRYIPDTMWKPIRFEKIREGRILP